MKQISANIRQLGLGKLKVKSSLMMTFIVQSALLAIGFATLAADRKQVVIYS